MRVLGVEDAVNAVVGGGFFAAGGGGWQHHGDVMGSLATSIGQPTLVSVDELPSDASTATVSAIGAPAAKTWEIQPLDYVYALQRLIDAVAAPIGAVMTAQNGYSTTLNGWIQSAVMGIPVLDAAGDVRAHPTGKLGSLGLTTRQDYEAVQSVAGGNRQLYGYFEAVIRGNVVTCDDVLRDISVRTGGFIAAARNPVELNWVRKNAAIGSISLAIDLGARMRAATSEGADAVIDVVCELTGASVLASGEISVDKQLRTQGGFDRGSFIIDDHEVEYLNEFLSVTATGQRRATYPDTIALISRDTCRPIAVKDVTEGMPVAIVAAPATELPASSSACDVVALAEIERITGLELVRYLPKEMCR
jgi:DUF917 family protein